jgi:hypothetical protein
MKWEDEDEDDEEEEEVHSCCQVKKTINHLRQESWLAGKDLSHIHIECKYTVLLLDQPAHEMMMKHGLRR